MEIIHGEASFTLETPELSLAVTELAGHLAPVTFHLEGRDVQPYALAPWLPSEQEDQPALLTVLRGDFFCLPFGGQEDGPPHGDPANAKWEPSASDERSLTLSQKASDSGAKVVKTLSVKPGQHALFVENTVCELEGDFNYGTHPILDLSGLAEGQGRISTSPFRWASTFPGAFSNPEAGERQCLAEGASFTDLKEVKLADGSLTDLSSYPARKGNDDLVMMVNEPTTEAQPFAWSAVVLDSYVWFCLKNPEDFPGTMLWLSNGGRSAEPWSDRHTGRLGVEEVCSYFSNGVDDSRKNPLAAERVPTVRSFKADEMVSLKVIQAVAALPEGFDRVASIVPDGDSAVKITAESGESLTAALDWKFLG